MISTKFLHTQLLRPPLTPLIPTPLPLHPRHRKLSTFHVRNATKDDENAAEDYKVEIRFRRGSRQRQRELENPSNELPKKPKVVKSWEEMSFSEKALELYVGEKGALYWLNKFAYASIFIIIGGWVLFRFVGPALNLYQLDTAPLAPEAIFKG